MLYACSRPGLSSNPTNVALEFWAQSHPGFSPAVMGIGALAVSVPSAARVSRRMARVGLSASPKPVPTCRCAAAVFAMTRASAGDEVDEGGGGRRGRGTHQHGAPVVCADRIGATECPPTSA
eukprot:scaffold39572_cov68-Phaeocystis_antarctica.AAC.6